MNRESQSNPEETREKKAEDLISEEIQKQILLVRDTGETNMFDINGVQRVAFDNDLYALVDYLEDKENRNIYCNFILGR